MNVGSIRRQSDFGDWRREGEKEWQEEPRRDELGFAPHKVQPIEEASTPDPNTDDIIVSANIYVPIFFLLILSDVVSVN
jgi:hypothetical protein